MIWYGDLLAVGLLVEFISEYDHRPVAEQLNENYAHGGGWRPSKRFTLLVDREKPMNAELEYPGDPVFRPRAYAYCRDELILVFDYALVAIVQRDLTFEVSRCD